MSSFRQWPEMRRHPWAPVRETATRGSTQGGNAELGSVHTIGQKSLEAEPKKPSELSDSRRLPGPPTGPRGMQEEGVWLEPRPGRAGPW